jgi:hypothetical protein
MESNTNSIKLDFTEHGQDSKGMQYNTLEQMWSHELEDSNSWYDKAGRLIDRIIVNCYSQILGGRFISI